MLTAEVSTSTEVRTYLATLRLWIDGAGFLFSTSVEAINRAAAEHLLSRVYGRTNVFDVKELLGEAAPAKQPTPEQLKVQSLQRAKDAADAALKSERSRQKVARAQKALQRAQRSRASTIHQVGTT